MAGYQKMPRIDVKAVERELFKAMNEVNDSNETQLREVTATWNHRPHWAKKRARVVGGDAVASISTDDQPFYFVNEGTSVRYATMTPDFNPKSKVRDFKAYAGRGGVAYVSKRIARPGIFARQWTDMLALSSGTVLSVRVSEIMAGIKGRPNVSAIRISEYNP